VAVTVRALARSDWRAFKELRLAALRTEPGVFLTPYARAAERTDAEWRDGITGPNQQTFGLFDGERLIGNTGVFADRDDPAGATAQLVMSYIVPEYRGRGLSALLYEARLRWVRERPQFERVMVGHRRSNEVSRRANQRFGFLEVGRVSQTWPDGLLEDEVRYELRLQPAAR
jgi:RimJ/RimL family protein N-acetyltransferase